MTDALAKIPDLSATALRRLSTCDSRIQDIVHELSRIMWITVVCGHRTQADQDVAVRTGKSKTPWPTSKHNSLPSIAVDLAPICDGSIDWNNHAAFIEMARAFLRIAHAKGVFIRWGGDWDGDGLSRYDGDKDERFVDLPHFELVGA